MGKRSSTPDVKGAAIEEGEASRATARDVTYADRPDQFNPYGSITWGQNQVRDPATGEMVTKWTQEQQLTPELQAIVDTETGMMGQRGTAAAAANTRAMSEMGQEIDWGQFGNASGLEYSGAEMDKAIRSGYSGPLLEGVDVEMGDLQFDPNDIRTKAEQDAYQKDVMRLDPQFQQRREQIDIRLRNQGLRPGDQAYDAQMSTFGNERMDAYERARLGAGAEGRLESEQLFTQAEGKYKADLSGRQLGLDAAGMRSTDAGLRQQTMFDQQKQQTDYANALREGDIEEYIAKRGFSLEEADRLRSGITMDDLSSMATGG